MDDNNIDTRIKQQIESNNKYSRYSKQGSDSGKNTTESILKIIQQQSNNNKESE